MSITVDPNEINRYMAEQLIKSAIGEKLQEVIRKQVEEASRSYNNPLEPAVHSFMRQMITDLLEQKFKAQVEERVRALLTEDAVNKFIDKMYENFRRNW